jgi:hypothetical protein
LEGEVREEDFGAKEENFKKKSKKCLELILDIF